MSDILKQAIKEYEDKNKSNDITEKDKNTNALTQAMLEYEAGLSEDTSELPIVKRPEIVKQAPKQLQDVGKITSQTPPAIELKPELFTVKEQVLYTPERVLSAVVEKPSWAATELLFRALKLGTSVLPEEPKNRASGWLNDKISFYSQPEKYGLVTPQATEKQAQYRLASYNKSMLWGIGNDVVEATTDIMALFIQMGLIQKAQGVSSVPKSLLTYNPLKESVTRMGVHGFVTISGNVPERIKATTYRIAYGITPYIANATGATGLTAMAIDTGLNTFLTSPTYIKAYKEQGGFTPEFISMVIPQLVVDIGMAWNTRGFPENIARKEITKYIKTRVEGMQFDSPKEGVDYIMKLRENLGVADDNANSSFFEDKYQQIFNKVASLENYTNKLRELGIEIKDGEDVGILSRNYKGVAGKITAALENGVYRTTTEGNVEKVNEGYKPIIRNYISGSSETNPNIRMQDLADYMIANRTIYDLQRQAGDKKRNIVSETQVQQANAVLDKINNKYGGNISNIRDTADRLYNYQANVLHLLVDSGNMSDKQYQKILSQNKHYIPFERVMEEQGYTGSVPSKTGAKQPKSPINTIMGSEKDIYNPFETIIKNTAKIIDVAEKNNIRRNLAKTADIIPEDVASVKTPIQAIKVSGKEIGQEQDVTIYRRYPYIPKGNVVSYFDNGKEKFMQLSPNMYKALTGLDEVSSSMLVKLVSTPSSWLRWGATTTPEFILRNMFRDQFTAYMQTNVGFRPFFDPMLAISDIVGKTDIYYEWLASGGSQSGFVELSRSSVKETYENIMKDKSKLRHLNIVSDLSEASKIMEQATRLAIYKSSKKTGGTDIGSAYLSREGTIDFARRGSQMKDINSMIAFFNANIQGFDKTIRTAKQDPFGWTIKGITSMTIPTILLHLINKDNERYKEIPQWQKDMFFIIPYENAFIRVPKPFVQGQIFSSIPERFLEYLDEKNPEAFEGLVKNILVSAFPFEEDPAVAFLPTIIKPIIEISTNHSFFLDRDIVPRAKQDLLAEEQYGKYTGEFAKELGKIINVSPSKIEHIVKGYFGGMGGYGLEGADWTTRFFRELAGIETEGVRPYELGDIPGVRGFIVRPPESSPQSLEDFYRYMNKYGKAYKTYQAYIKEGKIKEAENIADKYPNFFLSPQLNNMASMFSEMSKEIDRISKSKEFSQSQKKEMILGIEIQRLKQVQGMIELIKSFDNK